MNDQKPPDFILPPPVSDTSNQTPTPPPNVPTQMASGAMQPLTHGPSGSNPAFADDSELIEKEWVAKAKQIVGQTKDDPGQQAKAINQLKADYMKKRYNKDIKLEKGL